MDPVALACTALTVTALAAALLCEHREVRGGLFVAKPLASTGFLGVALAHGALESAYGQAVFVALVFSFFGDVFLMSKKTAFFRAGLFSFLLGHVGFAAAFVVLGLDATKAGLAAVVVLVVGVLVGRWIVPNVEGSLKGPVVAYIVVISAMVALSLGAWGATARWGIPVAAVMFYGSDLSVARDRFLGAGFGNRLWGLPLYYAAQLLFGWELAFGAG